MTNSPDVPDSGASSQPSDPSQPGAAPGAGAPGTQPTSGQYPPGTYPPQGQFPPGPYPPQGQYPPGQFPPGQQPQPGPFPPGYGAYVAPRKKSNLTWLWIVLAILPILLVGSCIAFISTADRSSTTPVVANEQDVQIGDCVRVTKDTSTTAASEDAGDIDIRSSTCTSQLMTWVVAEKVPTEAACAEGFGSLWWEEAHNGEMRQKAGTYVLCVHANYQQGVCYLEPEDPAASNASLSDYEVTPCDIPPTKAGFVVYKVETTSTAQAQCPEGQIPEFYAKPTPLGLCLTKVQFT